MEETKEEVLSKEELEKKKEDKIGTIIGIVIVIFLLIVGTWFLVNEKIIKPEKFSKCGELPDNEAYQCCIHNGSLGAAGADSCYHIYKLHLNETYGK